MELINEGYRVKIPTCSQLEQHKTQNYFLNMDNNDYNKIESSEEESEINKRTKQITTFQTGETRLVTKVIINENYQFFEN